MGGGPLTSPAGRGICARMVFVLCLLYDTVSLTLLMLYREILWLFVRVPERQSSRFYSTGGLPRTGWGEGNRIHIHNQLGASSFCAEQNAGKASGAMALISRACGSRWARRPAGRRTARERPFAGAFGGARAAGVLAAVLVQWCAKCCAGLVGQSVQAALSQDVCAGRARPRIGQEGRGRAIRAGGRAIRGVGGSIGECRARGGPV